LPGMMQSAVDTYSFRLRRTAYVRTRLLGWLLFSGFLLSILFSAVLGVGLLPTYSHSFTLYLKWQDALVALLWFITFLSLGGCILVVRFLHALHAGYSEGIVILSGNRTLSVRDLSAGNLASIMGLLLTVLCCFLGILIGLVPEMLLGWTLQLPYSILAMSGTVVAIGLSVLGLAVALPAASFTIVGCIGAVSTCRQMGASQTYQLALQTSLTIDDLVLTIAYPDEAESTIELDLLDAEDQRLLLYLLRKRWLEAQHSWNPRLGEQIEVALEEAESHTVLI
jgi:hypothetical protein